MEAQSSMSEVNKYKITWKEIYERMSEKLPVDGTFYGVPRGGTILAGLTGKPVDTPEEADYIIDDLIDSGRTMEYYTNKYNKPFYAIVHKQSERSDFGTPLSDMWIEFPWEKNHELPAEDAVVRILQSIGEDINREGIKDTPKRYIKFLNEFLSPAEFNLTTFDSEHYDEMIIQKDIPFYSLCEHHVLPFIGTGTIAYIPDKKIIGLSKLARVLEKFSHRLQNQERLTQQVANYLQDNLNPIGVAVTIKARHLCMEMRGIKKHDVYTITSCLKGEFLNDLKARSEYFKNTI
jgi:GTP cyclohydrolase I